MTLTYTNYRTLSCTLSIFFWLKFYITPIFLHWPILSTYLYMLIGHTDNILVGRNNTSKSKHFIISHKKMCCKNHGRLCGQNKCLSLLHSRNQPAGHFLSSLEHTYTHRLTHPIGPVNQFRILSSPLSFFLSFSFCSFYILLEHLGHLL